MKPLVYTAANCRPLSAKVCKNPCTILVFQKLWPFVSAHVRAIPTFKLISKSTHPSRFYYNYSLTASKLGFISNLSHFPSFHVEFEWVVLIEKQLLKYWGILRTNFVFDPWEKLIKCCFGHAKVIVPLLVVECRLYDLKPLICAGHCPLSIFALQNCKLAYAWTQ